MGGETGTFPNDVVELRELLVSSYKENSRLLQNNELLTDEIALLRRKIFGRKSEKLTDEELLQGRLFDEAETQSQEVPAEEPSDDIKVSKHTRKPAKRTELPDDLPTVEVLHDITDEEKQCACGTEMRRIGQEESKKLDIIPAKFRVIHHIRPKYACPACEGREDPEHPAVRIAAPAPQIIPKGIPTAGLLAFIIVSKFCDSIPLYRMTKQFGRIGVEIARSTLCGWVLEVARRCDRLIALMQAHIRAGPMIQMDETPVQVLGELGRENTTKSFMWVMRGGDPEAPVLLYQYHRNRSKEVPQLYLTGYEGHLQTDGFRAYEEIGRSLDIIHVGCWAHARRGFDEARAATKKTGATEQALSYIGKLYLIERRLRDQLEELKITEEKFVTARKEQVQPIFATFRSWLESKSETVLPSSLLGKAVAYTLGQWSKLIRYLDAVYLTPDTNAVENAIRPFVVGRKNWLFNGSPAGAHAGAALFSLIETAKANGIEPYAYLRHVFDRIPYAKTDEDFENLLPYKLDVSSLNTTNP
ncbi:MAG TPA: IS66 family transposase [Planctomycetes bacterium]|nr:IS66 family transposase [Planctomycetota bacterium]